jgi:hypothetical protein
MLTLQSAARMRSLADIEPFEIVRIERILFDTLKDLCHGIGLAEGDVVSCRRASRAVLLLETAERRTLIIDCDWARFIQVSVQDADHFAGA